jgi:hypothetical protein
MIARLFEAGADVFRINMSHTSHDAMRKLHARDPRGGEGIRPADRHPRRPAGAEAARRHVQERLRDAEEGRELRARRRQAPGDETRVHLPHPEILAALEPGHTLLLDDGKVRLKAVETSPKRAVTRVEVGGKLSARKGVSLPDTTIGFSALTDKDRSDLEACLDAGVDWVALSFIQRPEDIAEAKKITRGRASVMAKIEKPQAVTRLADIMDFTDALMVARGDLGVEMPLEKVPGIQKQITRASRRAGKPVVVATQMLESMITNPVPTRAKCRTWRRRSSRARTPSCSRPNPRRGNFRRGGRDHEPHRRGGRDRRDLSFDHRRAAQRARGHRCRRNRRRGAPDRRDARSRGHRVLDLLRFDGHACGTRAATLADRRDLTECRHRAETLARLGRALRR